MKPKVEKYLLLFLIVFVVVNSIGIFMIMGLVRQLAEANRDMNTRIDKLEMQRPRQNP